MLGIGPAGEKRSFIASVMNEKYRAAGRTGLSAVMGSKNLKAIAVKGEKDVEVADSIGLSRAVNKAMKKISQSGVTKEKTACYECPIESSNWVKVATNTGLIQSAQAVQ